MTTRMTEALSSGRWVSDWLITAVEFKGSFAYAWLASEPGGTESRIGDRTYLGYGVHLHARDPVTIGADCVIANGVFVDSGDHDPDDHHRAHGTVPFSIGDRVFVAQPSVVLRPVNIGDRAKVSAHAVLTRAVALGQTAVGISARPVGA